MYDILVAFSHVIFIQRGHETLQNITFGSVSRQILSIYVVLAAVSRYSIYGVDIKYEEIREDLKSIHESHSNYDLGFDGRRNSAELSDQCAAHHVVQIQSICLIKPASTTIESL